MTQHIVNISWEVSLGRSFVHSKHGNLQTLDPWLLITAAATTAILQLKLIVDNYYI